jgi:hypothetical protein
MVNRVWPPVEGRNYSPAAKSTRLGMIMPVTGSREDNNRQLTTTIIPLFKIFLAILPGAVFSRKPVFQAGPGSVWFNFLW